MRNDVRGIVLHSMHWVPIAPCFTAQLRLRLQATKSGGLEFFIRVIAREI